MNKSSDIAFSATYDAWGKRTVKRNTLGPLAHRNRCYFEQVIDKNGKQTNLLYITSPDGLTHIIANGQIYYALTDHLGSVVRLYKNSMDLEFATTYDVWGASTTTINKTPWLRRGFTMHEHWNEFGLIDMNGRFYDPQLGRFLSPNPYVQDMTNPQNFNRYSYCLNNPLKYTDPSGEFWHIVIGAAIGGVANLVSGIVTHKIDNVGKGFAYFGIGALAGAASAATCGGISSAMAGTGFAAGFTGSATAATATSCFASGALIGGAGGAISGSVTGFGNTLLDGGSFAQAIGQLHLQSLIGAASGAVVGGVAGGADAYFDKRNVWNGESVATGRSPFAIHNTPLESNVYITDHPNGSELIDNIERTSNRWVHKYDDYNHYHSDNNPMTGNFARRDNRILPGQRMTRSLTPLRGEANVTFSGLIPEGTSVDVLYDGVVVHSFGSTLSPMEYVTTIPSYVREITVIYNGTPLNVFHSVQPFNTTITGFRP